jgi:hypothetical protein
MPKNKLKKMLAETGNQRPVNFLKEALYERFCLQNLENSLSQAKKNGIDVSKIKPESMNPKKMQQTTSKIKIKIKQQNGEI